MGELTKDWIGEDMSLIITSGDVDADLEFTTAVNQSFEGIISTIQVQKQDNTNNYIVITAMSPTVLLKKWLGDQVFYRKNAWGYRFRDFIGEWYYKRM